MLTPQSYRKKLKDAQSMAQKFQNLMNESRRHAIVAPPSAEVTRGIPADKCNVISRLFASCSSFFFASFAIHLLSSQIERRDASFAKARIHFVAMFL